MKEKDLLHVELISENEMNIKLSGDPVVVCSMILEAMMAKQEIAAAMIASVASFAKEMGWDCGDLEGMVVFAK